MILIAISVPVSVGLWFWFCVESHKVYVIWHLGAFFNFLFKDSGQAIPRVVESCIRYINLYGELLPVKCVDILSLQLRFRISLFFSEFYSKTVTCSISECDFTEKWHLGDFQAVFQCVSLEQQSWKNWPSFLNIPGDKQTRILSWLKMNYKFGFLNQVAKNTVNKSERM